jgi:hypothetical protein
MVYPYTMPGLIVPLPQTVWRLKGGTHEDVVEVLSADRETVSVRSGIHTLDLSTRIWATPEFSKHYEPVKNQEGPSAKRDIRTRWERLLDDDGEW